MSGMGMQPPGLDLSGTNQNLNQITQQLSRLEVALKAIFPVSTLSGSKTYDPPSIAAGAQTSTTVTVTGCALGDNAIASFSLDTAGVQLAANVTGPDTVTVLFKNGTVGAVDLASGTLFCRTLR